MKSKQTFMSQHKFLPGTQADLQRTLADLNRKMQEDETKAKASSLGLPYVDLHNFPIDFNVLGLLEEHEAKALQAVVFYKDQNDMRIGAVDPSLPGLKSKLQIMAGKNKITLYIISLQSFLETLKLYVKILKPKASQDQVVRLNTARDFKAELLELKTEESQNNKTPSDFMEVMFGAAIQYNASDIHLEPEEKFVKLRFRVDGVLHDILHIRLDVQKGLITRLKILSGLKLNISNIPQDGRLTFFYLKKPTDVRVSILPSNYGEEMVMRLLNTGAVELKIANLGLSLAHAELLRKTLARPNGMVITTGPTGSGKTTTLYACLNELNEPGVKIITLEDPVEYKLEGIVQTPIDHTHDFDFAKGLRAILRQDPDIVMVGEIRDQETAETSMQAALTGHLVLSTLHTNDSAGAIPRLINMGIKPFVIAPALSLIMAQRLVRKLCQKCKEPAVLSPQVVEKAVYLLKAIPKQAKIQLPKDIQFFHAPGCKECDNLGYKGRLGVYELLENTESIQALIFKQAPMSEFKQAGIKQGMITMAQDGLLKALVGITDVEEVFRVAID